MSGGAAVAPTRVNQAELYDALVESTSANDDFHRSFQGFLGRIAWSAFWSAPPGGASGRSGAGLRGVHSGHG